MNLLSLYIILLTTHLLAVSVLYQQLHGISICSFGVFFHGAMNLICLHPFIGKAKSLAKLPQKFNHVYPIHLRAG